MSIREVFRYSWIKVSDEEGRCEQMRVALQLQQSLAERLQSALPGSDDARFLRTQVLMARAYLGGEVERGTRTTVFSVADAGSLSVDLVATMPHARSRGEVEITTATMPSGYTLPQAVAWLETPVGIAWSTAVLACRLVHAVVSTQVSRLAPSLTSVPTLA